VVSADAVHVPATRLEKTRTCFEKEKGLATTDVGNDVIAGSAADGALAVVLLGNGVHIALAGTVKEAQEIRRSYLRIDPALRLRSTVDRTVVYLWDFASSPEQRRLAGDCWY
jgi:hypothetical protein